MKLIHRYCCLLLLTICFASCADDSWDGVREGDSVPSFTIQTSDGTIITSDSLKGKAYLITFFNTGCKDCQQELPIIQQLYDNFKYDITFLNIARSESESEISDYWKSHGMSMPFIAQASNSVYSLFAETGIPRIYLVNEKGNILCAFNDSNMPGYEQLSEQINSCLEADGQHVGLTVKASVSTPRAERVLSKTDYSYNEYAINKLYAYFYDSQTKKLIKQVTVNNLTKEDDTPDQVYDISYICQSIMIKAGKYDIFFIANTKYAPVDVEDEDTFLNLTDDVSYSDGTVSNFTESGVIMTSCAAENYGIDLTDVARKHNTLSVSMERTLAKIRLETQLSNYELKHDDVKYADINLTNYQFVNLNSTFYLFRHTAALTSFTRPSEYVLPDNFLNDYEDRQDMYVLDPYFFKKVADDDSWYSYMTDKLAYPYAKFATSRRMASMPSVGNYASTYILENTSYTTAEKNAYSAGIVFKASVHPLSVYLYNSERKQLQQELRNEFWPNKLYFWKYNFYGSIRALNIASGLSLDELKSYTDAELLSYGVKQVDYNMGVYETYYTYWIRHNTSSEPSTPMKYGIVRNNFYQLKIVGISGIGNSNISPNLSRNNDDNSYSDDIVIK